MNIFLSIILTLLLLILSPVILFAGFIFLALLVFILFLPIIVVIEVIQGVAEYMKKVNKKNEIKMD